MRSRFAARRTPLIALVIAMAARASLAAPSGDAALLDGDAGIVARIDPSSLFAVLPMLAELGGPAGAGVELLRAGSKSIIGVDLTEAAGYGAAGLDPKRPIWIQLGAIDGRASTEVFEKLGQARDWTPELFRATNKVMWRSRIVVPVRRRDNARRALLEILDRATTMVRVRASEEERLAMLVGDRPKYGKEIIRALSQEGVIAIGWLEGPGAYLILRQSARVAIIEIAGPFAGVPVTWRRDRRKLLGALVPLARSKGGFAGQLGTGAARELATPGLHLWIEPAALRTTLVALHQTDELRHLATTLPQSDAKARAFQRRRSDPDCVGLTRLTERGQIRDFTASLRPKAKTLTLSLRWGLRATDWIRALRAPTGAVLPAVGIASGAIFVHHLDKLTGLWRPAALQRGFATGLFALTHCPAGSLTALVLTAWPELAAAWIADLRQVSPAAKAIVDGLAVARGVIRRASIDPQRAAMAAEAEVIGTGDTIPEAFDLVFGARAPSKDAMRWGRGPLFAFQHAKSFGFAYGQGTVRWFLNQPRTQGAAPAATLAVASFEPAPLLEQLAAEIDWLVPVAELARKHLGHGRAEIGVDGGSLHATASVELR